MGKILISISNCRRGARTLEKEFSSVVLARVIIPPEQRVHSLSIIKWRNGERSDPGLIYLDGDSVRGGSCSESSRRSLNFEVKPLAR